MPAQSVGVILVWTRYGTEDSDNQRVETSQRVRWRETRSEPRRRAANRPDALFDVEADRLPAVRPALQGWQSEFWQFSLRYGTSSPPNSGDRGPQ